MCTDRVQPAEAAVPHGSREDHPPRRVHAAPCPAEQPIRAAQFPAEQLRAVHEAVLQAEVHRPPQEQESLIIPAEPMTPAQDVSLIVQVPPAAQARSTEPPDQVAQGIVLLINGILLLPPAVETPTREVPLLLREAAQTMRGAQLQTEAATLTLHRREAQAPGEVPPIPLPPAVLHRVAPMVVTAAARAQVRAAADARAAAADR